MLSAVLKEAPKPLGASPPSPIPILSFQLCLRVFISASLLLPLYTLSGFHNPLPGSLTLGDASCNQ